MVKLRGQELSRVIDYIINLDTESKYNLYDEEADKIFNENPELLPAFLDDEFIYFLDNLDKRKKRWGKLNSYLSRLYSFVYDNSPKGVERYEDVKEIFSRLDLDTIFKIYNQDYYFPFPIENPVKKQYLIDYLKGKYYHEYTDDTSLFLLDMVRDLNDDDVLLTIDTKEFLLQILISNNFLQPAYTVMDDYENENGQDALRKLLENVFTQEYDRYEDYMYPDFRKTNRDTLISLIRHGYIDKDLFMDKIISINSGNISYYGYLYFEDQLNYSDLVRISRNLDNIHSQELLDKIFGKLFFNRKMIENMNTNQEKKIRLLDYYDRNFSDEEKQIVLKQIRMRRIRELEKTNEDLRFLLSQTGSVEEFPFDHINRISENVIVHTIEENNLEIRRLLKEI